MRTSSAVWPASPPSLIRPTDLETSGLRAPSEAAGLLRTPGELRLREELFLSELILEVRLEVFLDFEEPRPDAACAAAALTGAEDVRGDCCWAGAVLKAG